MEKAVGGHQAFGVRRSTFVLVLVLVLVLCCLQKRRVNQIRSAFPELPPAQRVEGAHQALRTRADIAARPAPGRDRVRVRQSPDLTEAKDRPDLAFNWVYDPDLFSARGDARPPQLHLA